MPQADSFKSADAAGTLATMAPEAGRSCLQKDPNVPSSFHLLRSYVAVFVRRGLHNESSLREFPCTLLERKIGGIRREVMLRALDTPRPSVMCSKLSENGSLFC